MSKGGFDEHPCGRPASKVEHQATDSRQSMAAKYHNIFVTRL